ncbi:MAG: FeoA domain-containing protein [Anaerolineales bacterium]|nr:FeoA domain-containing protein [Anaerolineales bacterium]
MDNVLTGVLIVAAIVAIWAVAPRIGGLALFQRWRDARDRHRAEDALKFIHAREWRGGRPATLEGLAGALGVPSKRAVVLARRLESRGLIRSASGGFRLTPEGEQLALGVIRAHRLWERYLVDEARMSLADVHAEAERREHDVDAAKLAELEILLGHPTTDPHGDPIPTGTGEMARIESRPLTDWPTGHPALVVHLEDEPPAVFAQIAAEGLRPGQIVRVVEATPERLTLSDGHKTFALAPVLAANIFVGDAPAEAGIAPRRLTALKRGETALVGALDQGLQGFTRRRLLDLGLTPGARITAELPSMLGDPVAYRVRGTLIALRRDQAEHVLISDAEHTPALQGA